MLIHTNGLQSKEIITMIGTLYSTDEIFDFLVENRLLELWVIKNISEGIKNQWGGGWRIRHSIQKVL